MEGMAQPKLVAWLAAGCRSPVRKNGCLPSVGRQGAGHSNAAGKTGMALGTLVREARAGWEAYCGSVAQSAASRTT
jgi:hypothetical protein